MTEDDTFLKLKKILFEDLKLIIESMPVEEFKITAADPKVKEQFLLNHGWTVVEYDALMKEMYGG